MAGGHRPITPPATFLLDSWLIICSSQTILRVGFMEEFTGRQAVHKQRWSQPLKGNKPAAASPSAPLCKIRRISQRKWPPEGLSCALLPQLTKAELLNWGLDARFASCPPPSRPFAMQSSSPGTCYMPCQHTTVSDSVENSRLCQFLQPKSKYYTELHKMPAVTVF